jgi:hypothetical protein
VVWNGNQLFGQLVAPVIQFMQNSEDSSVGDKTTPMRKRQDCHKHKRNLSVIISDIDTPEQNHDGARHLSNKGNNKITELRTI